MSLYPQPVPAIPEETARVAQAAFPRDNLYLRMRDEVGALCADETFADFFPTRGQPAQAPWRLALVTIMQYVEDLSDRPAADAVRSRIDWKYDLSPELTDPGYVDATLLVMSPRDYGVDLLGPTHADSHWQARAGNGKACGPVGCDERAISGRRRPLSSMR